ncbi:MAG: oligosaccharide flippase family protein [Planctomycetaceae bacterium]|nr:oligosaccharide flippase family protein [Planctomycetaceae bacterium]
MSRTLKDVSLVFVGRIGLTALWLATYVLTFRILGNTEAGKFAFCIVFIRLVSDCLGDALDLEVVRRVPGLLNDDREQAFNVWRGAFLLRIVCGVFLCVALFPVTGQLAVTFFHDSADGDLILVAGMGSLAMLMFRAIIVYFQSIEDFRRLIGVEAGMQILRCGSICALAAGGMLTARSAIYAYASVAFIACTVGLLAVPKDLVLHLMRGRSQIPAIIRYSIWMLCAMTLAAAYCHIDEFLVAKFRGPGEVGFYSAAMALALIPEFATGAVSSVLNPKVVRLYTRNQFRGFHAQYLMLSVPLGLFTILVMYYAAPLAMTLLYSGKYAPAIPALRLLASGTILWLVLAPLAAGLVTLVAPRRTLLLNVFMFMPSLLIGIVLIPRYGFIGAAMLFLGTRLVSVAVLHLMAESLLRKREGLNVQPLIETTVAKVQQS